MKTSSCKAKGRRFQQWITKKISEITGIECGKDLDLESRPMAQSGCDVIIRGRAKELFKFSVEAKNVEQLNIWSAIEQAKTNQAKGTDWLLFCKKNRVDPIVVLDAEVFFNLFNELLNFRKKEKEVCQQ